VYDVTCYVEVEMAVVDSPHDRRARRAGDLPPLPARRNCADKTTREYKRTPTPARCVRGLMPAAAHNEVRIRKWVAVAFGFVARLGAAQSCPQHMPASVRRGGDPVLKVPESGHSVQKSPLGQHNQGPSPVRLVGDGRRWVSSSIPAPTRF
jgi:hypothetical protein